MNSQHESEILDLFERLLSGGTDDERLLAATALARLGVRIRGNLSPRGSLTDSARGRRELEEADRIRLLLERAETPQLRCQIAIALGEWGGEGAARALAGILHDDENTQVRFYCVSALRTIGGQIALNALCETAESASPEVRDAAIAAVRDLATGGRIDDTDSDMRMRMPSPVRVRGASPGAGAVQSLERIRADKSLPLHVRLNAGETLRDLQRA